MLTSVLVVGVPGHISPAGWQGGGILVPSSPRGFCMLPVFLISAILVGMDWYLIVVAMKPLFKKILGWMRPPVASHTI